MKDASEIIVQYLNLIDLKRLHFRVCCFENGVDDLDLFDIMFGLNNEICLNDKSLFWSLIMTKDWIINPDLIK